jgi:hypothetical protein
MTDPGRAPVPGATLQVPGVQVPINTPTEQQATDTAINYGWLIALVIVVAVSVKFLKFIMSSKPVQIVAAMTAGYLLYKTIHGG